MSRDRTRAERGLPDPELWDAPSRLSQRELTADWGLTPPPYEEDEEDR